MELSVTHHNINLSESVFEEINKKADKLKRYLPNIPNDLSILKLNIKKIRNFFEGSLGLNLPRENLNISFRDKSLGVAIHSGFERLFRKLNKYKGLRFVDNSEYPKKEIIRGDFLG